jgi:hypothetical protein
MHHAQVQLIPLQAPRHDCAWLVMDNANRSLLATPIQSLGWVEETSIKRPTDRDETWVIFRSANNLIAPATPPEN